VVDAARVQRRNRLAVGVTWTRPEIAMQSNPRAYAQSNDYQALLGLCKQNGVPRWPYLFEKVAADSPYAHVAVLDLALPDKESFFAPIRAASAKERYAPTGKYIVPSEDANIINFMKALLAQM
jgi:hypothetical protein